MIFKRLRLQNFRNYQKQEFEFSDKTTLVVGPNTSGKTNLLEGIYLLSTGRSFRATLEQEMISYEQEVARVKGRVLGKERTDLEIVLTRGEVLGEKVARKKYQVNGVAKRAMDFIGRLRSVYFGPEDLDLVTDSPSRRRKYLDLVLSQVDREYARSSLSYEKGLRQRNKLLERIRDDPPVGGRSQLLFWDQLLIKNGEYLTQKREEFIQFCNTQNISHITYHIFPVFQLKYDRSIISPNRLEEYAEEEVVAGATLVGPHRDDFKFVIGDTQNVIRKNQTKQKNISHIAFHISPRRDISSYGSRGEQRLAILWLKLCELEFISQEVGERPLLLLDDIFSELDRKYRKLVLEVIPQQQTIITTADLEMVEKRHLKKMEMIQLRGENRG